MAFIAKIDKEKNKAKGGADSDDDAEGEEDEELVTEVFAPAKRIPPQWDPDMHHNHFLFDLIDNAGIKGISSMDLGLLGLGEFWRRSLDETINRLTNLWSVSQPPHLRHLSIIRDTAVQGKWSHYVFRTHGNFQKAVDAGETMWEAIEDILINAQPAEISDLPTIDRFDMDVWGFPTINPERMVRNGLASLAECRKVPASRLGRDSLFAEPHDERERKRKPSLYKITPSAKKQKTANVLPSVESIPDANTPTATPKPGRGRKALSKDPSAPAWRATGHKEKKQAERLTKSQEEWEKWARKTAESRAKLEVLQRYEADEPAQKRSAQEAGLSTHSTRKPKKGRPAKSTDQSEVLAQPDLAQDHKHGVVATPQGEVSEVGRAGEKGQASLSTMQQTDTALDSSTAAEASAEQPNTTRNEAALTSARKVPPPSEERIAQIEQEILSMSRPGVYMNPPGAFELKAQTYIQKGRPRNYIIAVFKTARLRELDWFTSSSEALPRKAPPSSRSKYLRSKGDATNQTSTPRKQTIASMLKNVPSASTIRNGSDLTPTPAGIPHANKTQTSDDILDARGSSHAAMDITSPSKPDHTSAKQPESQPQRSREDEQDTEDQTAIPPPSGDMNPPNPVVNPSKDSDQEDLSIVADGPSQAPAATIPESSDGLGMNAAGAASQASASIAPTHDLEALPVPDTRDRQAASQGAGLIHTPVQASTGSSTSDGHNPPVPADPPAPRVEMSATGVCGSMIGSSPLKPEKAEDAWDDNTNSITSAGMRNKLQGTSARSQGPRKTGVPRSGGTVVLKRTKIVMDCIRTCNGVFPGDRELWYPFVTTWERVSGGRPDRYTLDRLVKMLVACGKLKRITFTFQTSTGMSVTKHLLAEPGVDPDSSVVREMKQQTMKHHPAQYVPEEVEVARDLRKMIENQPLGKRAEMAAKAATIDYGKDLFPEDETAQVKRIPSAIKLGFTEEKIRQDVESRKRKREAQDLKMQRYLEALEKNEGVEEALVAMQGQIQVDNYQHNPKSAKGKPPGSRAKLSRRLRFDQPAGGRLFGALGGPDQSSKPTQLGNHHGPAQQLTSKPLGAVPFAQIPKYTTWENTGLSNFDKDWDKVEFLSLTGPSQHFHISSGTFSTDAAIVGSSREMLWNDPGKQYERQEVVGEVPTSLDDMRTNTDGLSEAVPSTAPEHDPQLARFEEEARVISRWEASGSAPASWLDGMSSKSLTFINHSAPTIFTPAKTFPGAVGLATSPHSVYPPPPGFNTRPSAHTAYSFPYTSPYSSTAPATYPFQQHFQAPAAQFETDQNSRRARPAAKSKLGVKASVTKGYTPRPTRSTEFAMTNADMHRLMVSIAVVRTLTGGLEQQTNWGLVSQCFGHKFDNNYCRSRWGTVRAKHGPTIEALQIQFREKFAHAYDNGDLPQVDFQVPEEIDWAALVDWADERLVSETPEFDDVPSLLVDRAALDQKFEVLEPQEIHETDKDEFFVQLTTHKRREEMAVAFTYSAPVIVRVDEDKLMLAKSLVRANVITPEESYNKELAHAKLGRLGDEAIDVALKELLGAKILRHTNKGRPVPGRNFDIADAVITAFKKPWDVEYLRAAGDHKKVLDAQFAEHGKVGWSYHATDYEVMVFDNLLANGKIKIVPVLPDINSDFDAPWPKISKWGFTEGNYRTVQMDKERLHWAVELHPTDEYVEGNPLKQVAPPLSRRVHGELDERLPLWVDINGQFVEGYWNMVLVCLLYLLAFRPGLTPASLSKAIKGKLWVWEIELFLAWAEEAGLARKMEYGGSVGWTTEEWWWLALAKE